MRDPSALQVESFLEMMSAERGAAVNTLQSYERDLEDAKSFLNERGVRLIWIEHDLMDPRTVSRKDMRAKVNEYMRTVMREEPVDPSLLEFDDEASW